MMAMHVCESLCTALTEGQLDGEFLFTESLLRKKAIRGIVVSEQDTQMWHHITISQFSYWPLSGLQLSDGTRTG